MTDTLLRQWVLLSQIPAAPHKKSTGALQKVLAAEGFPVDIRSLQRDLNNLSARFPLICDTRSKPYGWSWRQGSRALSVPGMSPHTALALKLTYTMLKPLLPKSALDALRPQVEDAEHTLRALSDGALKAWPSKVRIVPPGMTLLPPALDSETFYVAQEALLTGRRFTAKYLPRERSGKKPDEYEINPLGLVVRASVIYLVCTFFGYSDIRQLALHRLSKGKLLDKPCTLPPGFSLDAYIDAHEFDFATGRKIKLKAIFDAEAGAHLRESHVSVDQRIADVLGNRFSLSATVMDTAQLRWWLQSFGANVEVLSPKALRDEFRSTANALAAVYAGRK